MAMAMKLQLRAMLVALVLAAVLKQGHAAFSDLAEDTKDLQKLLLRKILPVAQDAIVNTDVQAVCSGALFKMLNGVRENSAWALKFVTSSGLVPSAVLYINPGNLGHYGQCVTSKGPPDTPGGEPIFRGKFCSMYVTPPASILEQGLNWTIENGDVHPSVKLPQSLDGEYFQTRLRLGVCVPSTCENQELTDLISHIVEKYELKVDVSGCRTLADEAERSTIFYIAVWTFFGLIVLAGASTVAEHLKWTTPGDLLGMFSLIRNNRFLFAKTSEKYEALAFLNGTKALLAFWIVLGHTYFMVDNYTIYTLKEAFDSMMTVFAQFVSTGGFLCVTTFFSISGFLLSHGMLSYKGPVRSSATMYAMIMIRRYIRLTVPAMAVILFSFVVREWAHGPTTDNFFQMYTSSCDSNWWRALTYTNNFVTMNQMCWFHYWYMSAEMQIFAVLIVLALMINRRPKFITAVSIVCSLCSCLWIISVTSRLELPPTAIFNENWKMFMDYLSHIYVKGMTHASSSIIGMLAGMLYVKASGLRLPKVVRFVSVVLCFIVMTCLIEATLPIYHHVPVPHWIQLLYAGFHRAIWSVACCWLFLLMATKDLQWLSDLLSTHVLIVLGRLSFGTYLVHVPLMTYYMGINITYVQMDHRTMVRTAIGNYVLSVILSYILHVLVEAPTIQLDTYLFKSSSRATSQLPEKKSAKGNSHLDDVKVDPATKL